MSNAIKIAGLNAVVTHKKGDKSHNKNKVVASHLMITLPGLNGANIGVAHVVVGGKWTEENALKEFKNQRQRFTLIDNGLNMAKAMNLI